MNYSRRHRSAAHMYARMSTGGRAPSAKQRSMINALDPLNPKQFRQLPRSMQVEYKLVQTFFGRKVGRVFHPEDNPGGRPKWFNGATDRIEMVSIGKGGFSKMTPVFGVKYDDGLFVAMLSDLRASVA